MQVSVAGKVRVALRVKLLITNNNSYDNTRSIRASENSSTTGRFSFRSLVTGQIFAWGSEQAGAETDPLQTPGHPPPKALNTSTQ